MTTGTNRSARTGRHVFTGLLLGFALIAALSAWGWRDNRLTARAQNYAQDIATSAAATYVTLRTVNAFLSTAQEIEVGASFGAQATGQPLKGLEPIDDTIERIAAVVFTIMVATGTVAVALGPIGGFGWLLLALACTTAALLRIVPAPDRTRVAANTVIAYGALLAIALPLTLIAADAVADRMTAAIRAENEAIIDRITVGLDEPQLADAAEPGFIERLTDAVSGPAEYRALGNAIYDNANALIASYINILGVFLFKVLILPILLMFACVLLVRSLSRP